MRIVIHRPRLLKNRKLFSGNVLPEGRERGRGRGREKGKNAESRNSESLVIEAIANLEEAIKAERCSVCKTWILNSKKYVEDKFDNLKYSQKIYNIMRERGISKPWHELDDETREELKRGAKKVT